jgi:hypothetical protein
MALRNHFEGRHLQETSKTQKHLGASTTKPCPYSAHWHLTAWTRHMHIMHACYTCSCEAPKKAMLRSKSHAVLRSHVRLSSARLCSTTPSIANKLQSIHTSHHRKTAKHVRTLTAYRR